MNFPDIKPIQEQFLTPAGCSQSGVLCRPFVSCQQVTHRMGRLPACSTQGTWRIGSMQAGHSQNGTAACLQYSGYLEKRLEDSNEQLTTAVGFINKVRQRQRQPLEQQQRQQPKEQRQLHPKGWRQRQRQPQEQRQQRRQHRQQHAA